MKYKKHDNLIKNFKNERNESLVNRSIREKLRLISNEKSFKSKLKALEEYELEKLKEKIENITLSEEKYLLRTNIKLENFRKAKESILKNQLLKSYGFQKSRIEESSTYIIKYMEILREDSTNETANEMMKGGEELLKFSREAENLLKGKEEVKRVIRELTEIIGKMIWKTIELEASLKELRIREKDRKSINYRIKEVRESIEVFSFTLSKANEIYEMLIKEKGK